MMSHMCGTYPVMDVIQDWAIRTVNRVEGALHPGPVLLVVVWDVNVSVLQPGVQDQPAVRDHQRSQIQSENAGKTCRFSPPEQESGHPKDSHIRHHNLSLPHAREKVLLPIAERRERPHVIGIAVCRAASGPTCDVRRPTQDQVRDETSQCNEVLTQKTGHLLVFVAVTLLHPGYMRLALCHVIGFGMMHCMGALPGKIRNHQGSVEDVAHRGLQPLLITKSAMATLMANDPGSSSERPLDDGVDDPQWNGGRCHWNVLPRKVSTKEDLQRGSGCVCQRSSCLLDQTILWNCLEHFGFTRPALVLFESGTAQATSFQS
mmetsp:Transcript_16946/g.20821  ORF Transcript_16946/g.20821 Transcript_16946/m.20821 type:complete len:318 (+) Transcript_16946:265-1218(+)